MFVAISQCRGKNVSFDLQCSFRLMHGLTQQNYFCITTLRNILRYLCQVDTDKVQAECYREQYSN